jgi:pyrimidine deaminase RibD-like protein
VDDGGWRSRRDRRREAKADAEAEARRAAAALDADHPLLGSRSVRRMPNGDVRLTAYQRSGFRDGRQVEGEVLLHRRSHSVVLARPQTDIEPGDCLMLPSEGGPVGRRWVTEIKEVPASARYLDPCVSGGMPRHLQISLVSTPPSAAGPVIATPTPARERQAMEEAIALARRCVSEPGRISPRVGAVVVRDGDLLAGAYRGELRDGEHAEYTLFEKKLADVPLAGATLYTTLEPCTARNAPKIPCVERIIERKLKRVVIGVLDPNDLIRGRGQLRLRDAGIEVALFDADLMGEIEELNRDFTREHASAEQRPQRSEDQRMDPPPVDALGPNGYRIGYTAEGDKVEWVPNDGDSGQEWPMVLRRNDSAILTMYQELWDKVWWNRHQVWRERIDAGEEVLAGEQVNVFARAHEAATAIEVKYGIENLSWDDFEWGLLSGRMSALAWVLGAEWDESLDT